MTLQKAAKPRRWNVRWVKDRQALQRVHAVDGTYQGRRVIVRDSPIDGGIFLGAKPREAVIVEFERSRHIKALYGTIVGKISKGKHSDDHILNLVMDEVIKALPLDKGKNSEAIVETYLKRHKLWSDGEVSLDVFVQKGIGVCRHYALLIAVLLERLVRDGLLNGSVSVDRNETETEGHAWCRFISERGKDRDIVKVLDGARDIYETAPRAQAQRDWPYCRPGDAKPGAGKR